MSTGDSIVDAVIAAHRRRSRTGMETFGITMAENPKSLCGWLRDLQEELMDATLYIESAIQRLESDANLACFFCGGRIIHSGDHDVEDTGFFDPKFLIESNLTCSACDAEYLVAHGERESDD